MSVPQDFAVFYKAEHRRLLLFLRKARSATWEDAADAMQESFIAALKCWPTIREPSTWIRTTALRQLDALRARPKEDVRRALRGHWAGRPDFEEELDAKEEAERVYSALASLPARQQEVMAWTYDGFTPIEIASILSNSRQPGEAVTAEAVRASLVLARRKLKQMLLIDGRQA
ncbi:RNA polymerase sigma factor [Streptomyces lasiicapitis]|uniref:RNA polymerase sigma factor n=1 Tax=Streptomyces lasiicapitis TaxID=1923961 RepID=UPI00166B6AC8|nr:sigma-70 family RNA polymerase sigma factor [Streptomyces lasiicapitis]